MEQKYNCHYVTTDKQGHIISGWSNGPHPERDTANAICINEQGGYQFRLRPSTPWTVSRCTSGMENKLFPEPKRRSTLTEGPSQPRRHPHRNSCGLMWTFWLPCRG